MKGAAFYVILTAALLAESDAAPAQDSAAGKAVFGRCQARLCLPHCPALAQRQRSEEHTSELQSTSDLVCRLLLDKKDPETLVRRPELLLLISLGNHVLSSSASAQSG